MTRFLPAFPTPHFPLPTLHSPLSTPRSPLPTHQSLFHSTQVILHTKILSASRKKGSKSKIAGVRARERRGKGRIEDSDFGYWNTLYTQKHWALGEVEERDNLIFAVVKAARKLELEKFLIFIVKTAATEDFQPLESRVLAAAIDACGHKVRQRGKGGCRGTPVAKFYRDMKDEDWEKETAKGVKNVTKILEVAKKWNLQHTDPVISSASRAYRALGRPYKTYEMIRSSMKQQKIPKPSVFAQAMMGALETDDEDLGAKVLELIGSSGYEFDTEIYVEQDRKRKEREKRLMMEYKGGTEEQEKGKKKRKWRTNSYR